MHVGLITYQTGHLKTWQLMQRLMVRSHRVSLFAFPFSLRPFVPGPFEDRPYQILDMDPKSFCNRHGLGYREVGGWSDEHSASLDDGGPYRKPDLFLTCIAKIIPKRFIEGRTILNCHPGLLPQNRGVDAFKWSIINGWPFGVTLHVIDEAVDRGVILHRVRVPVLPTDTLRAVADRTYQYEIDILSDFDRYLPNISKEWRVDDGFPLSKRRIARADDVRIEAMFLEWRERHVALCCDLTAQPHLADGAAAMR